MARLGFLERLELRMRKLINAVLTVLLTSVFSGCSPDPATPTPPPTTVSPPGPPASPSPTNGATAVPPTPTLTWASTGGVNYDVHFGTGSLPVVVSTGQPGASYSPTGLLGNTTYFWQIVSRNSAGENVGPVWSFTTVASLITTVEASYGKNCNVGAVNNQLAILSNLCNGKSSCNYVLQTNPGGDPCNQVRKDYDWSWTCSTNPSVLKRNHINGEALGSTIQLSCP
jgi:hypothetical protein